MNWRNHFLTSLNAADLQRLRPHLAERALKYNDLLDEAGATVTTVYLPIHAILSVVTVMQDGSMIESRTIGCESGHGLLHALGSKISFERMIVQVSGPAWTLPLNALRQAAAESPTLTRAIVRHAQATLLQSAQTVACNTLHSAEQRLCRWLLMTQDRLSGDVLPLTQEHLSIMLGVQRTTVTAVASQLQARRWVSYSRGRIKVLDRQALEARSCECYEAIGRGVEMMMTPD